MKHILDSFYTPKVLAEKLVDFIIGNPSSAIDFCIGDGDLMKAIENRFPGITCFGTDISDDAIGYLMKQKSSWHLQTCNFLEDEEISNIEFLKQKQDVILLNPPFTCKGSSIEYVKFDEKLFKVSTAMLFLIRAISFLSSVGGIYAIMPISCVYSQKDKIAWDYLKEIYNACILEEPERVQFSNRCSPSVVFVYVGYKVHPLKRAAQQFASFKNLPVKEVVRGRLSPCDVKFTDSRFGMSFLHTTNLQNGKIYGMKKIERPMKSYIKCNGVAIPRVCNPNINKVVLLNPSKIYALSDCIIVLKAATTEDAQSVRNFIVDHWSYFKQLYKGTCAKYTTVDRIKSLFGVSD